MKRPFLAALAGGAAGLLLAAVPLWRQHTRFAASAPAPASMPAPLPSFHERWQSAMTTGSKADAELRAAELAETLTAEECRAAAEAALATGKRASLQDVLSRWATLDGAAAFAWLERHPDLLSEDSFPDEAAAAWAASDPADFAAWLERFLGTIETNCDLSELPAISCLAQYDLRAFVRLAGGIGANSAVGVIIGRNDLRPAIRSSADAEAIGAEILAHPEWLAGKSRETPLYLLVALRECWQELDPDAWDRWAAAHPEAAEKSANEPVRPGLKFLRSPDRAAAASELLAAVPAGELAKTTADLLRVWDDMEAAGHWLNTQPDGPVKNAAAQAYALESAKEEPQAAFHWANAITDPADRARTQRRVFTTWHDADPAAAEAWLPQSGWTATQQQAARDIIAAAPDP